MSYYYKKYLKGSPDNDRRRCCNNEWHKDHCKRSCEDDCRRRDCDDEPAFGEVTGTITTTGTTTVTLPLNTLVSPSNNVRVAPGGGLTVLESGKYFISFTASFVPFLGTAVTYTINAGSFTQTITDSTGTATISLVRYLRRGDTVTVTASVVTALPVTPTTINAALQVSKVASRSSETDFC
ncbi:hypothetical protein ACLZHR_16570 [Priestia aryabhattai]|uniref:hypothetical protein n=1 Tax=Priestia TaxID=2800373 RepID=UPI001C8E24DE|nr:hypothetical protein [Priestia aryabhattai]MBY0073794.1 hypothetical protein [Priestia aryabhattai]MCL9634740.1 hypothetical protein [Bacillus zanthoxyli]